jgi:hypothetical protein
MSLGEAEACLGVPPKNKWALIDEVVGAANVVKTEKTGTLPSAGVYRVDLYYSASSYSSAVFAVKQPIKYLLTAFDYDPGHRYTVFSFPDIDGSGRLHSADSVMLTPGITLADMEKVPYSAHLYRLD